VHSGGRSTDRANRGPKHCQGLEEICDALAGVKPIPVRERTFEVVELTGRYGIKSVTLGISHSSPEWRLWPATLQQSSVSQNPDSTRYLHTHRPGRAAVLYTAAVVLVLHSD
jgi:hypothetical protein